MTPETSDQPNEGEAPEQTPVRQRMLASLHIPMPLIVFAVVALALLLGVKAIDFEGFLEPGYRFPDRDEIVGIHVRTRGKDIDVMEFDASKGHWQEILAGVSPSEYDPQPAPWPDLAALAIEIDDGRIFRVNVYELRNEPRGAFSVFSPRHDKYKFYRGGNTQQFVDAILAAAKEADEEQMIEETTDDEDTRE